MSAESALNTRGFAGVVMTMDWVKMPDGRIYSGFKGTISVLSAMEAVGWEPTGHNSANWLAQIVGEETSVNLMGCQVRVVIEGEVPDHADLYVVP